MTEPPKNVQALLKDGTMIPLELVYSGEEDGLHIWTAVTPLPIDRVRDLYIEFMPARTTLRVPGVTDA